MMTDRQQRWGEWLQQFSARRDDGKLQVWGISEWHNAPVTPEAIDRRLPEQLEAHLKYDVDQVIWDAGRSELAYHSDLPGATTFGDRDPSTPLHQLFTKHRPLEYYKKWCQEHDRRALLRLCMNRWYGGGDKFAAAHPEFRAGPRGMVRAEVRDRSRAGQPLHRLGLSPVREVSPPGASQPRTAVIACKDAMRHDFP